MGKKRILIMIMSCNKPFFQKELEYIKENGWLSNISKYENIDYIVYKAATDGKFTYNKTTHTLNLVCGDTLIYTYQKTKFAFRCLPVIFKDFENQYDYIFRTNASTYINLSLLDEFVNTRADEEKVYAPIIYSTQEQGPYKYGIFPQGSGLLIHTSMLKYLTDMGDFNVRYCTRKYPFTMADHNLNAGFIDDGTIGYLLCCHFCDEGKDIFKCFKEYGCVQSKDLYTTKDLDKYICISYRDYSSKERTKEFEMCDYIHKN